MQEKKDRSRADLAEWLEKRLDVSPGLSSGIRIEICGQNRLLLEGCRKILKYSQEEMLLDLGKVRLRVCGQRLWCTSFISGALGVGGHIVTVCFEEGERA